MPFDNLNSTNRQGRLGRVVLGLILASTTSSYLVAQQPQGRGSQPGTTTPTGPMANEKYKNIQVLTNVPADQLALTMRYVSAATGLSCVSCHVQEDSGQFAFEKDDKRNKQTARQMMKMVGAINAGNFGVQVACATCHAGHNQPVGLPLAEMLTPDQVAQLNAAQAERGGRGGPGGAAGGGRGQQPPAPPVDDILSKYFEAVGGRAAIEKVQSLEMTGTLTNRAGQSVPFTIEEKGNKYRETQQAKPAPVVRAFDGANGWAQMSARTMDLRAFDLDQALRLDDLGRLARVKEAYAILQASGRQVPINGQNTTVVTGRKDIVTEQFYFDSASGLLVRRVITTRTPLGPLREQIDYGDYRPTGGVKIPFEIKRSTWDTLDTLRVSAATVNSPIDDAKFAKPRG